MRHWAVLVVCVLLLSACGTTDDAAPPTSTSPSTQATTESSVNRGTTTSSIADDFGRSSTSAQANTSTAPTTVTGSSATASDATAPTSTGPSTQATTSDTSSRAGGASSDGCSTGSNAVPSGASSKPVIDVDGDGQADTAWVSVASTGTVTVGIATAAGGGFRRIWNSASPVTRSILVIRPNPDTPPMVLADDGRTVQLWVVADCNLTDVLNASRRPYTFSHGFTDYGTGVGCAKVEGITELVGLNITSQTDAAVDWTSTVVNVNGLTATNGVVTSGTYDTTADAGAIQALSSTSCGTQTIQTDGITANS